MPPLAQLDPNISPVKLLSQIQANKSLKPMGDIPNSSKKRARTGDEQVSPDDIIVPGEEDGDMVYEWNCNQIRNRINRFLQSGEMKVTHFQKHLGINSNSYGRFMKLKGPWAGVDNQTFDAAYKFFKKRELAGVKPQKKKTKVEDQIAFDVSGITLEGEEEGRVEIYDTCDDIRHKTNAHLRNTSISQAAFLRQLAMVSGDPDKKIQIKQLQDFLGKKGAKAGNASVVYYCGYVYFEKLRLKDGKIKSVKRQELERIYGGEGGMSRIDESSRRVWCFADEHPYITEDQYGRTTITMG